MKLSIIKNTTDNIRRNTLIKKWYAQYVVNNLFGLHTNKEKERVMHCEKSHIYLKLAHVVRDRVLKKPAQKQQKKKENKKRRLFPAVFYMAVYSKGTEKILKISRPLNKACGFESRYRYQGESPNLLCCRSVMRFADWFSLRLLLSTSWLPRLTATARYSWGPVTGFPLELF